MQFVLVDVTRHLSRLAAAMLNAILPLTVDFLFILQKASAVDFSQLPEKTTILFASDEYVSSGPTLPAKITKTFLLEHRSNSEDRQEYFAKTEDLICQLVDQIYRCYCLEAQKCDKLGDFIMSGRLERQGNRIHDEVRKAHHKELQQQKAKTAYECPETSLIFLTKKKQMMLKLNRCWKN